MIAIVKGKDDQYSLVVQGVDVGILYRLAGLDITVPVAIRDLSGPFGDEYMQLADEVENLFDNIRKTVDASVGSVNVA